MMPGRIAIEHAFEMLQIPVIRESLLVFCRLLGMLSLLPGLNTVTFSWQLRALILVTIAAILTPNVSVAVQQTLKNPVERATEQDREGDDKTVHKDEQTDDVRNHSDISTGLIPDICSEICLGLLLGFGANLLIQACRMAGTLIEHQSGMSLGQGLVPEWESDSAGSGELLGVLGLALFLSLGGHLLTISALLKTFETFPLGYGTGGVDVSIVVAGLIQHAVGLAFQIAAPLIASQLLISFALSHAGSLAPQFVTSAVIQPVRMVAACLFLILIFSGLSERLFNATHDLIFQFQQMVP